MTKIALFKGWKTQPENDADHHYKILECQDGERFPIHHSEIHSVEELKQGRFIAFEIQGNEAKNLRPLREVGVIDSWNRKKCFGSARILTKNSEFLEFFERRENGTAEVCVYIKEGTSGSKNIKRRDVVVFGIRKTSGGYKNKYRDEALNVKLLSTETDVEIIDNCVRSDSIDVLLAVLICSLNNCQYETVVNSIANILAECSVAENRCLVSKIPEKLKENDKIITFLSEDKKLEFWIKHLNNTEKFDGAIAHIADLLQSCADTKRSSFLSIIPETAKQHSNIFAVLSNDEKLEFWINKLNNSEEYESAIEQIAELLQSSSDNKRASVIAKIPLKAKQYPNIFYFLSDDEKVDFFVSQLQKPESYENALNGIAKILEQYPQKKSKSNDNDIFEGRLGYSNKNKSEEANKSYDDLLKLLKKIPYSAKNNEKLLKYLPPQEKIKILSGSLVNTLSSIEKIISHSSLSDSEQKSLISHLPEWVQAAPLLRKYHGKIPPAVCRNDGVEAEQIRAFVAGRKISCLCHFTTLENLQGICREGGVLSNDQLRSQNSEYVQIDPGRWDGKPNHISCSINSYNDKYFYYAKQRHSTQGWVLLGIKPDYLWKEGTLFCPINAASGRGAYIKKGFAGLKSMYEPVVGEELKRAREGLAIYRPTYIQAEVQVHESISLDDVLLVWVNEDTGNDKRVRDAGWKGEIKVWKGLFK
ncbi:MAG: DarT ssDNA thymidine ADP-ribosyltransferase family protein [Planktothrix sp.]